MLSDFEREMLAAYDALRPPRPYLGRYSGYHSFVAAPDGTLTYVRYQPEKPGLSPVDEVLAAVQSLPYPGGTSSES
jgi:peroxiredoxin